VLVAGQGVSLIGSAIASLALSIWLWRTTQNATAMSVATIAYLLPQVLLSPIAGTFVDRWGPRRTLLTESGGAAAASVSALALVLSRALLA
jgi:MFS family permease